MLNSTATRERIERIAWEVANLLADQYQNSRPVSLIGETPKPVEIVASALTALCEEMEREKQRSSLDRNSSEHKNCDSTCQECT